MEFSLDRTFPGDIHDSWNTLLLQSTTRVPFLRHEFLQNWWLTCGGGEWQNVETCIVTARRANTLAGIAPLIYSPSLDGNPTLLNLGAIEVSDYLDVIARESDLEAFLTELLPYLNSPALPSWKALKLFNLPEDSPTIPILKRLSRQLGWQMDVSRLQPAPSIPLPDSWDEYLGSLDKKQRHEIRRKMRRAEEMQPPARFLLIEDEQALESASQSFFDLMAQDSEKRTFLVEPMRKFMRRLIKTSFQEGYLRLFFLEIDGQKAATYFCFDFLDQLWIYNSGIDQQFNAYSPGWVLLGHMLQWSIDNGKQAFDFMRGDEEYKYRFGAKNRFISLVSLEKPS